MNTITREVEMNWTEDINAIIVGAAGVMAALGSFIAGHKNAKRTETDTKGAEIDNVGKAIEIWEKTADKLVTQVDLLNTKHAIVVQELSTLHITHQACEQHNRALSERLVKLESAVCIINTKVNE